MALPVGRNSNGSERVQRDMLQGNNSIPVPSCSHKANSSCNKKFILLLILRNSFNNFNHFKKMVKFSKLLDNLTLFTTWIYVTENVHIAYLKRNIERETTSMNNTFRRLRRKNDF
jgi:hypothetical protein